MLVNKAVILAAFNAALALAQTSTYDIDTESVLERRGCTGASNNRQQNGCPCNYTSNCQSGSDCVDGRCEGRMPLSFFPTNRACDEATTEKIGCKDPLHCFTNDMGAPECRLKCGKQGVYDFGTCPQSQACLFKTQGFAEQKHPVGFGSCIPEADCLKQRHAYLALEESCWSGTQEIDGMSPPAVQQCGSDRDDATKGFPGCPSGQACVLETTSKALFVFEHHGNGICASEEMECCSGKAPWAQTAANSRVNCWTIDGIVNCSRFDKKDPKPKVKKPVTLPKKTIK